MSVSQGLTMVRHPLKTLQPAATKTKMMRFVERLEVGFVIICRGQQLSLKNTWEITRDANALDQRSVNYAQLGAAERTGAIRRKSPTGLWPCFGFAAWPGQQHQVSPSILPHHDGSRERSSSVPRGSLLSPININYHVPGARCQLHGTWHQGPAWHHK